MKILLLIAAVFAGANGGVLNIPRYREGKIVGGTIASISEAPYQVAILENYEGNFLQVCGGSLISATVVLTAAHCTDLTVASQWRIRAGSSLHDAGGQLVSVAEIVQHKNFTRNLDNDISLLKLSSPVQLGPNVGIISLPQAGQVLRDGTMVLVTGWGYLKEGGISTAPKQLYKVSVPIINQAICVTLFKFYNPMTKNMICAGYLTGRKDTCQGDSGGPAVVGNVQHGITSWGRGCARPSNPGVYTKLSNYIAWIGASGFLK